MKERVRYVCEICHTEYNSKSSASQCEETHVTKLKITDKRYVPFDSDNSGFPIRITVVDDKGKKAIYKR